MHVHCSYCSTHHDFTGSWSTKSLDKAYLDNPSRSNSFILFQLDSLRAQPHHNHTHTNTQLHKKSQKCCMHALLIAGDFNAENQYHQSHVEIKHSDVENRFFLKIKALSLSLTCEEIGILSNFDPCHPTYSESMDQDIWCNSVNEFIALSLHRQSWTTKEGPSFSVHILEALTNGSCHIYFFCRTLISFLWIFFMQFFMGFLCVLL